MYSVVDRFNYYFGHWVIATIFARGIRWIFSKSALKNNCVLHQISKGHNSARYQPIKLQFSLLLRVSNSQFLMYYEFPMLKASWTNKELITNYHSPQFITFHEKNMN